MSQFKIAIILGGLAGLAFSFLSDQDAGILKLLIMTIAGAILGVSLVRIQPNWVKEIKKDRSK